MARKRARVWFAGLLAAAGAGCATVPPGQIVQTRDLPESTDEPRIESVVDLGGRDVPAEGSLGVVSPDGVIAVGETLWIRGSNFGRQPTIKVGGRSAQVLSRTADGGILVRVPTGTITGSQRLEISTQAGVGSFEIQIRRYAVVLPADGGRLGWIEFSRDSVHPVGVTVRPASRFLALSSDGRAAYVAGAQDGMLDVIDLAAGPKGVQPSYSIELGKGVVQAMQTPVSDPSLIVLRAHDIQIIDTRSALRPARRAPQTLPKEFEGQTIVSAAVSPDGSVMAVGVAERNRILFVDLTALKSGRSELLGELAVDADAHVPTLVDLLFSPGGETLWVLSGEISAAPDTGPRPTRVHAIRVTRVGAGIDLSLARSVDIPQAAEPRRITTSRSSPLQSGAAIRVPPELVTVFVSARVRDEQGHALFSLGSDGVATEIASVPGTIEAAFVEPEGRWVLATFVGADGGVRLIMARADGRRGDSDSFTVLPPPGKVIPTDGGRLDLSTQP